MNMEIEGKVEYFDIGTGAWGIVTDTDLQYEIYQPAPEAILQEGIKVRVTVKVRDDVMTLAAIGDVVEILEFHII